MSAFRIILVFVAISFAGFALLPRIAVNLQPVKQSNVLQVSCELPEAAPEVVENQITARLENVFSQLSDIEKITSVSRYNSGNVTLHLNKHADLAYKKMEVAALIRQVYPQLPVNSSFPVIYENVSGNRPVPLLVYAVAAPFSPDAIRRTIEQKIKSPLSLHRQVEEVKISGVNPLEIVVEYDQEKLLAHNLSRARIVELISNHGNERYLGLYEGDAGQRLFIRTENDLHDLQAFEELYLLPQVRLKDVAKVYVAEQEAQSYFRINGLNSVRLSVFPREKANTLVLAAALREQIAQIEKELPKGYQLVLEEDNTEKISEELNKIYYRTGLSVLILIGFILLAYFNVRYLAVLMSGVLINLLITCIFVYVLGIQIHLYSLAGLTISFGMIVDNAIVMLDHLRRKGNRFVFLAILGATFTTLAALLPVWLLPEEQRDNLIDFALIIIVNLSVSLLVALFYTPAAYQLLIGEKKGNSKKEQGRTIAVRRMVRFQQWYYRFIRLLAMRRGWVNFLLVLAFGTPVFLLPPKIEGWTWYNDSIGSEWYQEYARPYVNRALGGSIRLFYTNVYEGWGFRSLERKQLYVSAELPFGSTLEQMNESIIRLEKYLSKIEGVEKFVSMVYSGTYASVSISFKPAYENSSLPLVVKSEIIARSIDWGGVGWSVWGVGDGFSNSVHDKIASFRVKMQGYNYPVLEQQAEKMAKRLLKHPRIQEVNTNELMDYTDKRARQFVFELNNDALLDRGVSLFEVREGLEARSKSNAASLFVFHKQEQYPIRLREKKSEQYSVYQSQHVPIDLRQRSGLLMRQVGEMRFEQTSPAIYKENRQYLRRIAFEYFGSEHFGSKYLGEVIKEMNATMPLGYTVKVDDTYYYSSGKSDRDYKLLVLLLLGIFIVTCILFESFRQPFLILLSVPLSYIGLFLAFAWGGFYFDQGGYAAFLLLSGLVVNAGIFVINDFNQFRGGSHNRNIIKAIMQKAMPILMSIASTVLGLVPFLSEGDKEVFWFSFATGGISGLLSSLLGLFIILPVWMWKTR